MIRAVGLQTGFIVVVGIFTTPGAVRAPMGASSHNEGAVSTKGLTGSA